MTRIMTAMLMAGLMFTQVTTAFAGIPLGPSQLKSLVPGHYKVTLMGVSTMIVTLKSNGSVLGSANGAVDRGFWKLSGNKICVGWHKWLGGSTHCSGLSSEAGYYQGSGFTITPI